MKRIIVTLAALAISSVGFAENLDSYASVLKDAPAPFKDYSSYSDTLLEDHGNVLLDRAPRRYTPVDQSGLDIEISIGDANSSLFETDAESSY